jgi:hypothetical protein
MTYAPKHHLIMSNAFVTHIYYAFPNYGSLHSLLSYPLCIFFRLRSVLRQAGSCIGRLASATVITLVLHMCGCIRAFAAKLVWHGDHMHVYTALPVWHGDHMHVYTALPVWYMPT